MQWIGLFCFLPDLSAWFLSWASGLVCLFVCVCVCVCVCERERLGQWVLAPHPILKGHLRIPKELVSQSTHSPPPLHSPQRKLTSFLTSTQRCNTPKKVTGKASSSPACSHQNWDEGDIVVQAPVLYNLNTSIWGNKAEKRLNVSQSENRILEYSANVLKTERSYWIGIQTL